MTIWLAILLAFLPMLLKWLIEKIHKGGPLHHQERIEKILGMCQQIESASMQAGYSLPDKPVIDEETLLKKDWREMKQEARRSVRDFPETDSVNSPDF